MDNECSRQICCRSFRYMPTTPVTDPYLTMYVCSDVPFHFAITHQANIQSGIVGRSDCNLTLGNTKHRCGKWCSNCDVRVPLCDILRIERHLNVCALVHLRNHWSNFTLQYVCIPTHSRARVDDLCMFRKSLLFRIVSDAETRNASTPYARWEHMHSVRLMMVVEIGGLKKLIQKRIHHNMIVN